MWGIIKSLPSPPIMSTRPYHAGKTELSFSAPQRHPWLLLGLLTISEDTPAMQTWSRACVVLVSGFLTRSASPVLVYSGVCSEKTVREVYQFLYPQLHFDEAWTGVPRTSSTQQRHDMNVMVSTIYPYKGCEWRAEDLMVPWFQHDMVSLGHFRPFLQRLAEGRKSDHICFSSCDGMVSQHSSALFYVLGCKSSDNWFLTYWI